MDLESRSRASDSLPSKSYRTTLLLAYQSFGVVYGDLSISPIYVYKSTFSGKLRLHEEDAEILGVLSLVFWTLTLIALCKYIIFVLAADDDGEGAFVGLLRCTHNVPKLKMGLLSTLPCCAGALNTAYNPELSRQFLDSELRSQSTLFLISCIILCAFLLCNTMGHIVLAFCLLQS
ncbi:hypothetical protein C4D60_Mb08t06310 [Musa balbisiana]|uniref:K+ potassium transporter integral membrane domain-containing protein n=1 Tax=Musa balbisiana TaxID=52838 RepID=A0A4S8K1R0_MUSBA|nr:hypothetical protein C4D60_Mb08t06310 [Musa balbisiana]